MILTPAGLDCVISGWGITNATASTYPDKLQYLLVKADDWNDCKKERPLTFKDFYICAGTHAFHKATCLVIQKITNQLKILLQYSKLQLLHGFIQDAETYKNRLTFH
jgi:hypothetical protein